jgi:hypothetical protein
MNSFLNSPSTAQYRLGLNNLYGQSNQADRLPSSFFGDPNTFQNQAYGAQNVGTMGLHQAMNGFGGSNYLNAGQQMLQQGMQSPQAAAQHYTDLLRQQALPQEQQAASSMMNNLFARGRLGTTGGANQMGALQSAQSQADIQRQIAGQDFGFNQRLQQLGAAQSLSNQGVGMFGAGMQNAGMGLNIGQQADAFGFNRMMGLNQENYSRTQDRFNRGMQMFGLDMGLKQQDLLDAGTLAGLRQGENQQLMDLGRIGASVGSAQASAGAQAAQIRNAGTQNAIAGMMGAFDSWNSNRVKGRVARDEG